MLLIRHWHYEIWNNRDLRKDNKSFFYKKYYDIGICEIGDLLFDLSNTESYEQIAENVKKTNFLEWTIYEIFNTKQLKSS